MFKVIEFSKKDEWKKIIDSKKEVYYSWEYVSAFYKNGDGIPYLAYCFNDNDIVFNVFFKRDISDSFEFKGILPPKKYYDIITPYGYGGLDIVGTKNDNLIKKFSDEFNCYCRDNNIISEFIRYNPIKNNWIYDMNQENIQIESISKTVYIKLENPEQIWNDMESRCRNTIRKAQKEKVNIKIGFDENMLYEFKEIYYKTMQRDSAELYYFFNDDFFNDYYLNMNNKSFIVTAYFENIAISSALFIYSGDNGHYHLSGTLSEYLKLGANSLILYEAAKKLCSMGYKKLHLGGGYGGDRSSLLKFKESFSKTQPLDFYIGKKIYNQKEYDELIKLRISNGNFNINSTFFPKYRV